MLKYDVKGKTCMVHILWQRLLGKKVVFITSTDNHGEKIATTAAVPMVIYIYIYIYEGFYCVYCVEYQELFAFELVRDCLDRIYFTEIENRKLKTL